MKTMTKFTLIFAILLISILTSCDKDNDFLIPNKTTHRIKQIVIEYDKNRKTTEIFDLDEKYNFIYDGERLINIIGYVKNEKNNWIESNKAEIIYNYDTISKYYYEKPYQTSWSGYLGDSVIDWNYKQTDTWILKNKHQLIFVNDLLIEEIFNYNYEFEEYQTWGYVYNYSGNNLICFQEYYSTEKIYVGKLDIIYNNDKISKMNRYKDGNSDNLTYTLNYNNNNLTSVLYSKNFEPCEKSEYVYSNNNISQIYFFEWNNNNWGNEYNTTYIYNNNDLIEETVGFHRQYDNNSWSGGYKATYEYEDGIGNAKYLFDFGFSTHIDIFNYPSLKSCEIEKIQPKIFMPYFQRNNFK